MSYITGIGGIFVKSKDGEKLKKWYKKHLTMPVDEYGARFKLRDHANPEKEGYAVWGIFKDDSEYFDPSKKDFMINFRVSDLDGLLKKLKSEGIEQVGKMAEYDFGRFAWIIDPEGTKIELWEPAGGIPD
ncbi:MAG: VOC family protein [Sphingomonadales bacterium]